MTTPLAGQLRVSEAATEEFEVLLVSDDLEPGYGVIVPALPGCFSQGDDWDEALAMAVEAIAGFLEIGPRPVAPPGEKERLVTEFAADGFGVAVATVRVIV